MSAAATGDGVRIDGGARRDDAGAWAAVRVLSGAVALRLRQHDPARGQEVTVIQAVVEGDLEIARLSVLSVAVSADRFPAFDSSPRPIYLDVVADGGPAEWILDAVTLTDVPQAAPYAPRMGPAGLLEAAAGYLAQQAAYGGERFEGEWLVVPGGPTDVPVRPGDPVTLRLTTAQGTEDHRVRCLSLEYREGVGQKPTEVRGRFGALPFTLRDAVSAIAEAAAKQGRDPDDYADEAGLPMPPPPLAFVDTAQGEGPLADTVRVTVGVPRGDGAGSSVDLTLTDASGESPAQTLRITYADFMAADAAGDDSVSVAFPVYRGGVHTLRAVPVKNGREGGDTEVPLVIDASAVGTTSRSLPTVRGLRWRADPQQAVAWWAPWADTRVSAVEVVWAHSDSLADLLGTEAEVLARPGVAWTRRVGGASAEATHRYPIGSHRELWRPFVRALAAGTAAYVAATDPDAATDDGGNYFLAPSGLPVLLPAPATVQAAAL